MKELRFYSYDRTLQVKPLGILRPILAANFIAYLQASQESEIMEHTGVLGQ